MISIIKNMTNENASNFEAFFLPLCRLKSALRRLVWWFCIMDAIIEIIGITFDYY